MASSLHASIWGQTFEPLTDYSADTQTISQGWISSQQLCPRVYKSKREPVKVLALAFYHTALHYNMSTEQRCLLGKGGCASFKALAGVTSQKIGDWSACLVQFGAQTLVVTNIMSELLV